MKSTEKLFFPLVHLAEIDAFLGFFCFFFLFVLGGGVGVFGFFYFGCGGGFWGVFFLVCFFFGFLVVI